MATNTSSGSKSTNTNIPKSGSNPNWPSKTGEISGKNRGNNPPKK